MLVVRSAMQLRSPAYTHSNFRIGRTNQPLYRLSKGSPWGCEVPDWERGKCQCQQWVFLGNVWICIPAHLNHRPVWIHQPLPRLLQWSPWGCEVTDWERCKCQCQWWVLLGTFWICHPCPPKFQTRMDTPAFMSPLKMVTLRLWSSWKLRKAQTAMLVVRSAMGLPIPGH
jgi:hypothetical protein